MQLAAIKHAQNVTIYSLGFTPVPQAAYGVKLSDWICSLLTEIISTQQILMGLLNDKTSPWYLQMEDKLHSLAYLLLPLQHKQLSEVQNVSAFPSVFTLEVKVEVSRDTPEGHPRAAKGGRGLY